MNTRSRNITLTAQQCALAVIALRHMTHTNERRMFDDRRSPDAIRNECRELRELVRMIENTNA